MWPFKKRVCRSSEMQRLEQRLERMEEDILSAKKRLLVLDLNLATIVVTRDNAMAMGK